MARKQKTLDQIKREAIGLIDNRQTDNDGLLIKRDRSVTMVDIFGTEQKTAVAYYVSDLLAKGFNNQQIVETIKNKYNLDWTIRQVNIVKELLHKMWRCEIAHTMNDQIAREVATIDTQIKETWEAWEFSKKGITHKKNRKENSKSEAPEMAYDLTEIITEEDTSAGDVKFLQHLNDLGKEKRKLLGLYAPEKKSDDGVKTAVQFNIVGEGAGGELTSLMQDIMKNAPVVAPKQAAEAIEEAQVVETNTIEVNKSNVDIDKLMETILD